MDDLCFHAVNPVVQVQTPIVVVSAFLHNNLKGKQTLSPKIAASVETGPLMDLIFESEQG